MNTEGRELKSLRGFCLLLLAVAVCGLCLRAEAQPNGRYAAKLVGDTVRLSDKEKQVEVAIAPYLGDMVFSMRAHGKEVIYFPDETPDRFRSHAGLAGVPFLAPWANRLDEFALYANGKRYQFNPSLGNVVGEMPVHGFLSRAAGWQIVEVKADQRSAWLTSRLEFYRHPDWMAQFPFAHTIEMTQKLHDGVLEIHVRIVNLSTESMPVLIGFHPYFQLTDSDKREWRLALPAREHYLLRQDDIPTGKTEPIGRRAFRCRRSRSRSRSRSRLFLLLST